MQNYSLNEEVFYSVVEGKIKIISVDSNNDNIYTLDGAAAELFQILMGDIKDVSEADLQKKCSLSDEKFSQFKNKLVSALSEHNILIKN